MNLFELERLRREGKCVNLPGGRCALDVALEQEFEQADFNIDLFYIRKRQERDLAIINEESKHQDIKK